MPAIYPSFSRNISRKPLRLFVFFWLCTGLLYSLAWKGGFGADFHGWLQMYYHYDFGDVMNRRGTSIHSLYQVTQFQLWVWTWLFGTHLLPWFCLFTGLQAANGALLYYFFKNLFGDFKLTAAEPVALLGALLFLLQPSMTEVVVWKASYHYLTGVQAILWILLWARNYLVSGKRVWVWRSLLLFVPLTFTLEIWYAIPWLVLLMVLAYSLSGFLPVSRAGRALKVFFLPMLVLFGLHLLLYHTVFGTWVAHGAFTSSGKATWAIMAGRVVSYEFHALFLGRFFPGGIRQMVYHKLADSSGVAILVIGLVAAFIVLAWVRYRTAGPRFRLLALLVGWSLLALGLILPYMPADLFVIGGDRYTYFTLLFQCMMIALIAGALLPRRKQLFAWVAALLLVVYAGFTLQLVWYWRQAAHIFWSMQQKYRWEAAPEVIILNMPSYYNGIQVLPAEVPEALNEHLKIFRHDSARGRVYDVLGYNMQQRGDGAFVTVMDSLHLKVTLAQWGSWWWYGSLGAADYENEVYSVHMPAIDLTYLLTLKKTVPGRIILFQQGDEWRVVDMSRKGTEQR